MTHQFLLDHLAQFVSIKKKIIRAKHIPVYRRNFSDYNEQLYIDDVFIQTWNPNKLQDINGIFNDFVWRLEGCVDRHAPITKLNKKHINKTCKPWISKTILKMISHKDRLFRKKKEDPVNNRAKRVYNLFRNRVTTEIRKTKKEYYRNYFENNTSNMKNIWNGIRNILSLGNKNHSLITQIDYKGKHVSSNPGMANAFNSSQMLDLSWMS